MKITLLKSMLPTLALICFSSSVLAETIPFGQFSHSFTEGNPDKYTGDEFVHVSLSGQGNVRAPYSIQGADTTTGQEAVYSESGAGFYKSYTEAGSKVDVQTVRAMAYELNFNPVGDFTATEIPFTVDWTLKNYLSSETINLDFLTGIVSESQSASSGIFIGNANQTLLDFTYSGHGEKSQSDSFVWDTDWGTARVGLLATASISLTALKSFTIDSPYTYNSVAKSYADPIIKIDPNWEHADKYSVSFNYPELLDVPSTTSVSAVPVPTAAFMFAPALFGFLALRRSKSRAELR